MKYHEQRLRRAMEDHEYLAPHPVAVYERVQLLARIYRRRRFLVQSAGGVLLGAGMLFGLVQMHGFIQGGAAPAPAPAPAPVPADAGVPSAPPAPARSVALSTTDPTDPTDAYLNAGYDWDDAEHLAGLWNLDDPTAAKVMGGRRLLSGKPLPIRPGGR